MPELDILPKLKVKEATNYQSLINILRWLAKQGRICICLEVSAMPSYFTLLRKRYLN